MVVSIKLIVMSSLLKFELVGAVSSITCVLIRVFRLSPMCTGSGVVSGMH